MKVGMNQWSVLSYCFHGCIPSETGSGIPSELLYADDLAPTAKIMESLGRRLNE